MQDFVSTGEDDEDQYKCQMVYLSLKDDECSIEMISTELEVKTK